MYIRFGILDDVPEVVDGDRGTDFIRVVEEEEEEEEGRIGWVLGLNLRVLCLACGCDLTDGFCANII